MGQYKRTSPNIANAVDARNGLSAFESCYRRKTRDGTLHLNRIQRLFFHFYGERRCMLAETTVQFVQHRQQENLVTRYSPLVTSSQLWSLRSSCAARTRSRS